MKAKILAMIEITGQTIIYTVPSSNVLGQVSPYLLLEKLEDEIALIWPQLTVNKVFVSGKEATYKLFCVLPNAYAREQIRVIKLQIELIASNLLTEIKDKIYFAGLAS